MLLLVLRLGPRLVDWRCVATLRCLTTMHHYAFGALPFVVALRLQRLGQCSFCYATMPPLEIRNCRIRQSGAWPATVLVCAGIWQSRQLFVSTNTSVHAIFADPVQQFVQVRWGSASQPGRCHCPARPPCLPVCLPSWQPAHPFSCPSYYPSCPPLEALA
jgi:hypothetical protein